MHASSVKGVDEEKGKCSPSDSNESCKFNRKLFAMSMMETSKAFRKSMVKHFNLFPLFDLRYLKLCHSKITRSLMFPGWFQYNV